jgi:cytoskeletal protein RodZ
MSETNEPNAAEPAADQPPEKVGDILRKERVTRRISLETIAKDLKLNVNYIKALETNKLENLPADPYVRVYLRSLASYLMLNPDDILRKFYEERGLIPRDYKEERSTKMTVSVKEKERIKTPWVVIGSIIAVLAILSYISNKAGWMAPAPVAVQQSAVKSQQPVTPAAPDTTPLSSQDSLLAPVPDTASDTAKVAQAHLLPKADSLRLTISVTKDSVWVQAFIDGVSWRNYLYPSSSRTLAAADSINVHVGSNGLTKYTLNNNPLKVKGRGAVMFKVDHGGLTIWKSSQWNSVFKSRL